MHNHLFAPARKDDLQVGWKDYVGKILCNSGEFPDNIPNPKHLLKCLSQFILMSDLDEGKIPEDLKEVVKRLAEDAENMDLRLSEYITLACHLVNTHFCPGIVVLLPAPRIILDIDHGRDCHKNDRDEKPNQKFLRLYVFLHFTDDYCTKHLLNTSIVSVTV